MKDSQIAAMLAAINRDLGTTYELVGKMERGTNGAWLVATADGVKHIFKRVSEHDVTEQVSRSAYCADAVHTDLAPTARYEQVAFTNGVGTWYVQELLPGIPSPRPSFRLVQQMIALNKRQSRVAIDKGVNWSERVKSELFADAHGWQKLLAAFSDDGRALVERVREMVAPHADALLPCNDIVHGDFQHFNALVADDSDHLTGYVDWEGAGCGDRSFDLARLLYDVYVAEFEIGYRVNPMSVLTLRHHILQIGGLVALELYMAYWVVQVSKFAVNCKPAEAAGFFQVGQRILDDLEYVSTALGA